MVKNKPAKKFGAKKEKRNKKNDIPFPVIYFGFIGFCVLLWNKHITNGLPDFAKMRKDFKWIDDRPEGMKNLFMLLGTLLLIIYIYKAK